MSAESTIQVNSRQAGMEPAGEVGGAPTARPAEQAAAEHEAARVRRMQQELADKLRSPKFQPLVDVMLEYTCLLYTSRCV